MTSVAQVLRTKSDQAVYTIGPTASVYEALRLMADHNVGAIVVMAGDEIVGMFTERDYARKIILADRSSRSTPVADIMSAPVHCVRPSHTVDECMALMTERRLRHLPVVDERGRMLGLISIGDLVKETISEQQFVIEQLEHYITGARY